MSTTKKPKKKRKKILTELFGFGNLKRKKKNLQKHAMLEGFVFKLFVLLCLIGRLKLFSPLFTIVFEFSEFCVF